MFSSKFDINNKRKIVIELGKNNLKKKGNVESIRVLIKQMNQQFINKEMIWDSIKLSYIRRISGAILLKKKFTST